LFKKDGVSGCYPVGTVMCINDSEELLLTSGGFG